MPHLRLGKAQELLFQETTRLGPQKQRHISTNMSSQPFAHLFPAEHQAEAIQPLLFLFWRKF